MNIRVPKNIFRTNISNPQGRVRITPRNVYIFPTRYGFLFGALLLLLLIGSVNYGNNLAFFLTFLLVGLAIVAILHTWRNLIGLELSQGTVEPVFAGQEAIFEIYLKNGRDSERPGIKIQTKNSNNETADIDGNSHVALQLQQPTSRRGLQQLGKLTISTSYPLGLLRAWGYVELDSECLVYPNPELTRPPAVSSAYDHSSRGDKGVGVDDFVGLRTYRPGDAPRHINWKSVASGRGVQTKQFGGDRADRIWLEWDSMPGIGVEKRLSRICRGILDACEKDQEFGLRIPGSELPPSRGQKHRHLCLKALAMFEEDSYETN